MSFNPPYPPTNDLTYAYGQLVWQYDGTAGVWNIKDGATVGGVGPKGDQGDPGNAGEAGPRGATGATGVVVMASYTVTGAASFDPRHFVIGGTGHVTLLGAYEVTGQTVVSGGGSQLVNTSGNIATIDNRVATSSLTGVASFNSQFFTVSVTGHVKQSGGYDIGIQTTTHQIPFMDAGGTSLSGDPDLLWNGSTLTFGGSITKMTITGPSLVLGYSTAITGGIFMTPAESARYMDNGTLNTLTITASNGTVQRFKIAPTTNVTVQPAASGWHTVAGTTETICVIVQSTNGQTGIFSSNILTSTTKPVLFGTTGGIDVFTIMRVAIDASNGLVMAFQTAKGMTAANFNING